MQLRSTLRHLLLQLVVTSFFVTTIKACPDSSHADAKSPSNQTADTQDVSTDHSRQATPKAAVERTAEGAGKPSPIAITSLQPVEPGYVVVDWSCDQQIASDYSGFIIECRGENGAKLLRLSKLLPVTSRRYVDQEVASTNGKYFYRVYAQKQSSILGASKSQPVTCVFAPKPPKPTGLTAQLIVQGEKRFVDLVWDQKNAGDKLTDSYILHTNSIKPGRLLWHSNLDPIRSNQHRLELSPSQLSLIHI